MAFAVSCGLLAHAHSACAHPELERLPYQLDGCVNCWSGRSDCRECKGRNKTEFTGCPETAMTPQIRSAITAFLFLNRFGLYPSDGGLYSQTPAFVSVVEILCRDLDASEEERARSNG